MWIRDLSAAGSGIPGFRIRIDFMYTDPDPAFFLIADPDPGSGSRVWWSKIEKNLQLES